MKRLRDDNDKLRRENISSESKPRHDIGRSDPEIEKGQREALESKNKEIGKLKDQLRKLEVDIEMIKTDKEVLEKQKKQLEEDLKLEKELNNQKDTGAKSATDA